MSQSTRFGKSLCGLISYDIRVSESAETPGSPANRRTNHERVTFPKAAGWIGLLALAVGLFQVAWAAKDLLPSGIFHDPRTESQLRLLFDQGALSAFSGGVLSIGGFHLDWTKQRPRKTGGPSNTSPEPGWHRTLLAVAVLIVFGILALSILPTPSRDVAFSPRDFQPLAQPINVTTYGAYRVSRNFWADQGGVLAVDVQITWTDNRTGGILFNGTPGTHEVYAASASSPRESPTRISYFVAPSSGFYVLVVWLGRCVTLTSGECANTTGAFQAQTLGTVPTIYLPAQLGGSVLGPALVAISVVASRGRRRIQLP